MRDNSLYKIGERSVPDGKGNNIWAISYRKFYFSGLPIGKVIYLQDETGDIFHIYYRNKTWLVIKNGANISSGRIPKRAELGEPLAFERSVKVMVWRGLNKMLPKAKRRNIESKTGKIITILLVNSIISEGSE